MGEIALWILFYILIFIAFLGCFISRFPGPILAFGAILIAKLFMKAGELISWGNVIVIAVLVAASIVLNRLIPQWGKKLTPYGKSASTGAIVGSILALILSLAFAEIKPAGVAICVIILTFILLTFLFAFAFEYIKQKDVLGSAKASGSATVVYVCTTLVKLITVFYSVFLMFYNN